MRCLLVLAAAALFAAASSETFAQERGATALDRGAPALGHALAGLSVSVRVLMVAAHPDDEDTQLLAFLARGRHVETAYLSLTRGDGGQNLIGNELGEALGVIRTEELLAARRIDGAHQYFTRAYDFGFSKSADETLRHWPNDSILLDVVTVVRAFRPHIIVAVFSGTPRDGHGHHQLSGILAREVFDAAADSVRYPASATAGLPAWAPLKLYQSQRTNTAGATVTYNVGEYSPLLGRSYAEIAGLSRSQHKSQGFGTIEPRGVRMGGARIERSRVGPVPAVETSLFEGIDTTWARFKPLVPEPALIDSLDAAIAAVRRAFDPFNPASLLAPLAQAQSHARRLCGRGGCTARMGESAHSLALDFASSQQGLLARLDQAIAIASGVAVEASAEREVLAAGSVAPVTLSVYNRGSRPVLIRGGELSFGAASVIIPAVNDELTGMLAPDSVWRTTHDVSVTPLATRPWWLEGGRAGGMFVTPPVPTAASSAFVHDLAMEDSRPAAGWASVMILADSAEATITVPITYRYADRVHGEVERPAVAAPAIAVSLDRQVEYARAGEPYDKSVTVTLTSAASEAREVSVSLRLPRGLSADSARRSVNLAPGSSAVATFNVRGLLGPGRHEIHAVAESGGESFGEGYQLIDYPHIRRQRIYGDATIAVQSVELAVPPALRVAYIPGVGDNVAPVLERMGIAVTVISPEDVAYADLSTFTTVVVGPRAYDASPELAASNTKLFEFVRGGGTMVVQYGQNMSRPGIMPFVIGQTSNEDRVTEEDSPVRIVDPASPLLRGPNRITLEDFEGWVQERATYMPRAGERDPAYRPVLAMNDTGERPLDGGLLVASMGAGTYVYCTLALFRQLPAGVPGAARIMVNLLAAGVR